MLVVRYLIALVFSIFMMATSLKVEERYRRQPEYKISTPDRLALQMERRVEQTKLQRRRLGC
ncbi:CG43725 [Drosophila busckii]|uniref:CG43725 n=1 Tax=Drosophila busckii TaxID=30019 RepID=A0A0M4E8G2_DROBS|nr:uncharacterized protein LOC108607944 [Drosophila busckii]ALC39227.1 CG43725 [Drosophila busckii]